MPLFGDVFFTTWTQYPRCITQQRVLDMAGAIRSNGYPCSTITIDDRWESAFGTLQFSEDFPDPKAMVAQLHEMGLRVILWVTPFVDVNSPNFGELTREGVLVGQKGGDSAATLKWWGGQAGLIDVTGPTGRDWLHGRLARLRSEIGVDGFKIDGGDPKYMPPLDECRWANDISPCGYIDELLAVFEEVSPGLCKNRTVWLSQSRKILWHVGGKDTHWGIDNGLKALVTLSLHMALLGYDILIPDMIPGRVQTLDSSHPLASDELMVRWTEVSAFMPMMQFSYLPWNYESATAKIVRQFADVHKSLEAYSFGCASERKSPLLRPIWYDWPEVEQLYCVDDEFMLGPDLLVAPVLNEDQAARDVILPPGDWLDAWTGNECKGRLNMHPTPCPGVGVFVRSDKSALFETLHEKLREIARGTVRTGVTTTSYDAGLDREISVTG